jgi:hypothetical protein
MFKQLKSIKNATSINYIFYRLPKKDLQAPGTPTVPIHFEKVKFSKWFRFYGGHFRLSATASTALLQTLYLKKIVL